VCRLWPVAECALCVCRKSVRIVDGRKVGDCYHTRGADVPPVYAYERQDGVLCAVHVMRNLFASASAVDLGVLDRRCVGGDEGARRGFSFTMVSGYLADRGVGFTEYVGGVGSLCPEHVEPAAWWDACRGVGCIVHTGHPRFGLGHYVAVIRGFERYRFVDSVGPTVCDLTLDELVVHMSEVRLQFFVVLCSVADVVLCASAGPAWNPWGSRRRHLWGHLLWGSSAACG
jgi:hypothetical protein